ncbi:Calx-beta domain-containing protein, partial [Laspinema olomoucense]|uniref:Calx-beta domain-containing protein n=1 Tax=Laspinema olomoucense TaxID=3231600 RepID=UPI00294FF385
AETVYYSVSGSATNGSDYSYLSGFVTIPAGSSFAYIPVDITNDSSYEGTEQVQLTLNSNSNYTVGSNTTRAVTIYDNDVAKSTVSINSYDNNASEDGNSGYVQVTRSGGNNSQSERVYYSISGSSSNGNDYSYLNSYIDIPAGSTTAYIPINPINDSIYEGTETVSINLQSSSAYNTGSSTSGMVYIYDNDVAKSTINIGNYDIYAMEGVHQGSIQVTRSGGDNNLSERVYYSISGSASNGNDYTYLPGYIDIPAGSTTAYITVRPNNDSDYEGTEEVRVNLQSNSNYNASSSTSGYVYIYDDDPQPKSTIEQSLIGVTWNGSLVELDTTTGSSTTIGYPGFSSLNSLAVDSKGDLYTISDSDSNTGLLIKINPQTGQGTIATTFNNDFNGVKASVRDLAFSSDGTLYGIHDNGSGFQKEDSLFKLNPNTGEVTLIGDTGLSSLQSLAIASDGSLYSWDFFNGVGLVTINPLTGVATDVNESLNSNENIQDLAFDSNGILYGAGEGNALYKIDPITGKATQVSSSPEVRGIAFVPKT